jgi:hypothetical protein
MINSSEPGKELSGIEKILLDAKHLVGGAVKTASSTFWQTIAASAKIFGAPVASWVQSRIDDQAKDDQPPGDSPK